MPIQEMNIPSANICIGEGINPVVRPFLVAPAFWSFWLSGLPAVRSFGLSGCSSCLVILTILQSLVPVLYTKEIKKGEVK